MKFLTFGTSLHKLVHPNGHLAGNKFKSLSQVWQLFIAYKNMKPYRKKSERSP